MAVQWNKSTALWVLVVFNFATILYFTQLRACSTPASWHLKQPSLLGTHEKTVRVETPIGMREYSGRRFATSTAQEGEDVFANDNFFRGLLGGTVLESGALDGRRFSVSHNFEYELGWKAVLIEAGPRNFELLQQYRPNAMKVHSALCSTEQTLHYAEGSFKTKESYGDAVAGIVEFMSDDIKQAFWKGTDWAHDPRVKPIHCRPLTKILNELKIKHIDFWILDVEGAEWEVVQTMDFSQIQVDVMVVELDGTNPEKDRKVRDYLSKNGFRVAHTVPRRNTWFVGPKFAANSGLAISSPWAPLPV